MEVFYSRSFEGGRCTLDPEESAHCVRVLRHREGDEIFVIDGEGTLYTCTLTDASPKAAVARILREEPDWGAHPYFLRMAVCPTKNLERYEWFAEKATELGLDEIVPVIGDHSERKVFKPERLRRILLSASKQSLKGAVPQVADPISVRDFIAASSPDELRLICCCFEGEVPRQSINDALAGEGAALVRAGAGIGEPERTLSGKAPLNPSPAPQSAALPSAGIGESPIQPTDADGTKALLRAPGGGRDGAEGDVGSPGAAGVANEALRSERVRGQSPLKPIRMSILIGPEGDFSREEAALAIQAGFIPVHLGPSRLRTETAALTAVEAVYLHFI